MTSPQKISEGTKVVADLEAEALTGLRKAADGLNAAAEDGFQAAVADGLLPAGEALVAVGDLLHGNVALNIRVAGYCLRRAARALREATCSRCGLAHKDYDLIAWDEGHENFDCRVLFTDSQSCKVWLLKNTVVEDSEAASDVPSFVSDSLSNESESNTSNIS